jgi:K+ transporter
MRSASPTPHAARTAALMVGALGVVFGDIGTSPRYAMHAALASEGGVMALIALAQRAGARGWILALGAFGAAPFSGAGHEDLIGGAGHEWVPSDLRLGR